MDIKAAIALGANEPLVVDTVSLDAPQPGEVLIKLDSSGICHSDLHLIDGNRPWDNFPIVLGHEGAGTVVETGPGVTRVKVGDKVIPGVAPECGTCPACRSQRTNLCDEYFKPNLRKPLTWNRQQMSAFCGLGTFAEYVLVREMQVAKIRSDAPLDEVCCLGCAGVTGIGAVTHTARVQAGSSVAVFGLGGIGLNVIDGARICGATTIIAIDVNPLKEAAARQAGATHFLNSAQLGNDVVNTVKEITNGGADYSFECIGVPAVMQQAIDCTRVGWGVTVVLGIMPGPNDATVPVQPRSFQCGKIITGSYMGNVKTLSEFPEFIDWYVEGKLTKNYLISHRISLDQINEGIALVTSGQARRVVIDF
jgi:S-(hydroxymethyl)glutathione dehydrogenase/alcohol dehydrogenase